jgi:hypothetical protein
MLGPLTIILVPGSLPLSLQSLGVAAAVHEQAPRLFWKGLVLLWVVLLVDSGVLRWGVPVMTGTVDGGSILVVEVVRRVQGYAPDRHL